MLNINITANENGGIESISVQGGKADKPLTINTTKSMIKQGFATRFSDNGDGTVTDNELNLMWSKDDISTKELKHAKAVEACKELSLAGFNDWRLPERKELASLVDDTRHEPAINIEFFPSCKSTWYWTNTPCAWAPDDYAWLVSFSYGLVSYYYRSVAACVRAVRSVSPPSQ